MILKSNLFLKKGDIVQIVAPAGRSLHPEEDLQKIAGFLKTWGLIARWSTDIFGLNPHFPDLANTDAKRFRDLKKAIFDPKVKAIWCFRGGYGSARLIPYLRKGLRANPPPKVFIGFSDITLLHLYFQEKWQWQTFHASHAAAVAQNRTTKKDNELLRQLIFGEISQIDLCNLKTLNKLAKKTLVLTSIVVGGNLTLISRSIGSDFAIDFKDKILILEDIEEPFRKIDGMLQQLLETEAKPKAVIFGNMSTQNKKQKNAIEFALQDFAGLMEGWKIPVLRTTKIGHGKYNQPLPLLTLGRLSLGKNAHLLINNIAL